MKGFPNIQNRDYECLIWCLAMFESCKQKSNNVDREFTKHLNFNPIQDGSF